MYLTADSKAVSCASAMEAMCEAIERRARAWFAKASHTVTGLSLSVYGFSVMNGHTQRLQGCDVHKLERLHLQYWRVASSEWIIMFFHQVHKDIALTSHSTTSDKSQWSGVSSVLQLIHRTKVMKGSPSSAFFAFSLLPYCFGLESYLRTRMPAIMTPYAVHNDPLGREEGPPQYCACRGGAGRGRAWPH